MSDRLKTKTKSQTGTGTLEFDEFELQSTMQEFLKEEPKDEGKGIWNISTFAGLGMLFLALTYLLQLVGLPIGAGLANFSADAITGLPIIGGVLVTLIGFGYLVGDKRRERKARRKEKRAKKQTMNNYSADIPGAEKATASKLKNDLDSTFSNSSSSQSTNYATDSFGYRHAKRLMKSRTNKKLAGVCGGLARYFGISSTVVRLIFVVSFFMYGTSILIYLGLAIAMPKEPIELMDDFDF